MVPKPPSLSHAAQALAVAIFSLKLLLFPAKHSTDLEVHRHWKALTHSLPLSKWYTDTSSPWTLDYPPLFAYFEYLLSHVARKVHPQLLSLSAHDYPHPTAKTFLRATVLFTDPFFSLAAFRYATTLVPVSHPDRNNRILTSFALSTLLPGIFLVDNIHFQYNALPLAFLLLTLTALHKSQPSRAAFFFSIALNLKHTLLPTAPPIAVALLLQTRTLRNLLPVALTTIATFTAIWAPIFLAGGRGLLLQVARRLFPFSRGLLHAYWAPNVWALYAGLDKVLSQAGCKRSTPDVDVARGIIGAKFPFTCLPNVTEQICATLVLGAVCVIVQHMRKTRDAAAGVALCALAGFLFGWHVHEKAVLVALVPLAGLAGANADGAPVWEGFLWVCVGGGLGLMPLVAGAAERMILDTLFMGYLGVLGIVGVGTHGTWRGRGIVAYGVGAAVVETVFGVVGLRIGRWEFLPLLVFSVYAAFGVFVGFLLLARAFLGNDREAVRR